MTTIRFVDALAGPGKTFAMAQQACDRASAGEGVLLVLPTLHLSNEVEPHLRRFNSAVTVDVIHGGVADQVIAAVLASLKQGARGGRVLIITWSAFVALPFFPGKQNWIVFVDEIPQVCSGVEAAVPVTHSHLTDHVELRPQGPEFSRVVA